MELLDEAGPELDEENMDEEATPVPQSASYPEPRAGALSPPRPPPLPPRPPRCILIYSYTLTLSLSLSLC